VTRALYLVLLLAACGGGSADRPAAQPARAAAELPQSPAGIDRAIIEKETLFVEDLTKRSCACTTDDCRRAADDELGVYFRRRATFNDPIDDIETWPKDLDDRAHAAVTHHYTCVVAAGVTPYSAMEVVLRVFSDFRERACTCQDAACAQQVVLRFQEETKTMQDPPSREAQRDELMAIAREMGGCVEHAAATTIDQQILDLKALRKRACDCETTECGEAAKTEFYAWVDANQEGRTADQHRLEQFRDLGRELGECLAALGVDPARDGAADDE